MLGLDAKRNATVRVESDGVSLMVLEKVQFYQLVEEGEVDGQVLTKMWNEKRIREIKKNIGHLYVILPFEKEFF